MTTITITLNDNEELTNVSQSGKPLSNALWDTLNIKIREALVPAVSDFPKGFWTKVEPNKPA